MEMNVSVNFKFVDESDQKKITSAFDIVNLNSEQDYSDVDDKLAELKKILTQAADVDQLIQDFEFFDEYVTGLEYLKQNKKSGTTSLHFVTGWDGEVFAKEIKRLLQALGASRVKVKTESAEGDEW